MLNIIAIIVLFGAIQGFLLCLYLYFKKKDNKKAFNNFILFLFSLSFFNFIYALMYMKISTLGFIPLTSFPFPYKYLIAVGFYFFIRSQISKEEKIISKYEYLLFLPAFFYGILRIYWYIKLHTGLDKDIFWNVYKMGFFTYNEYVYLIFNLLLVSLAIKFLTRYKTQIRGTKVSQKNWEWLLKFSYVFIVVIILNIVLAVIVHIVGDLYNGIIYSIILILNSIYIYWVGFESLTKSNYLFNTFTLKKQNSIEDKTPSILAQKLEHYMKVEEVFKNKNLKLSDLAYLIEINEKELSVFIYESFEMSFSEYINRFRIEKVKTLLKTEDQKKYTLLAIAENAGFSSKSSFNAVFKKFTGLTPSQYKASLKN